MKIVGLVVVALTVIALGVVFILYGKEDSNDTVVERARRCF